VISDTHGLLRAEATTFLRGCDRILHAGDIGAPEILERLAELAPLTAVRGNNDTQPWAASLPASAQLQLAGVRLHLIHDLAELSIDPPAPAVQIVVCGHSHQPSLRERDGVIYLNPGSAGPRRFRLPVSVAEILIDDAGIRPRLVALQLAAG
jgi:hypothetical protein